MVCDAGDDGAAAEGVQRRPLGVPGAVGALVTGDGRRQVQGRREGRGGEGRAPDEHGEDGVVLVRHRRRAAAALDAGLGQLRDLGARQRRDVGGHVPPRVGARHQGVGRTGDRTTRGVPGPQLAQPQCLGGDRDELCGDRLRVVEPAQRGELGRCREGADSTAELHRQEGPGVDDEVGSIEDAVEPAGGHRAERGRDGVLGERTADHRRRHVPLGEDRRRDDLRAQLVQQPVEDAAQGEHERRVEHVLAGQAAMQPGGAVDAGARAEQGDECRHGVARRLGAAGQLVDVVGGDEAGEVAVAQRRSEAGHHERVEPGVLHLHHRLEQSGFGHQLTGAFVAGPEQIGHACSLPLPGNVRNTVSPSP